MGRRLLGQKAPRQDAKRDSPRCKGQSLLGAFAVFLCVLARRLLLLPQRCPSKPILTVPPSWIGCPSEPLRAPVRESAGVPAQARAPFRRQGGQRQWPTT